MVFLSLAAVPHATARARPSSVTTDGPVSVCATARRMSCPYFKMVSCPKRPVPECAEAVRKPSRSPPVWSKGSKAEALREIPDADDASTGSRGRILHWLALKWLTAPNSRPPASYYPKRLGTHQTARHNFAASSRASRAQLAFVLAFARVRNTTPAPATPRVPEPPADRHRGHLPSLPR